MDRDRSITTQALLKSIIEAGTPGDKWKGALLHALELHDSHAGPPSASGGGQVNAIKPGSLAGSICFIESKGKYHRVGLKTPEHGKVWGSAWGEHGEAAEKLGNGSRVVVHTVIKPSKDPDRPWINFEYFKHPDEDVAAPPSGERVNHKPTDTLAGEFTPQPITTVDDIPF